MAKKRMSVFDLPQDELQQISKTTIERNAKPKTAAQQELEPATEKEPPKPTEAKKEKPKAAAAKPKKASAKAPRKKRAATPAPAADESLKVIRVRESFHRRAKGRASLQGLSLGAYIEQLIDGAGEE